MRLRNFATLAPLALSGCGLAVLTPRGPIGLADKTILIDFRGHHAGHRRADHLCDAGVCLVVPRRATPGPTYLPNWAYSGQIELVTWAIPLMTIILLGGVAWVGSHELDPPVR